MEWIIYKKGVPYVIFFDEADLEIITGINWKISEKGYVRASHTSKKCPPQILLHRFLLGVFDKNIFVDHKNRNPLDNRRENLRLCTKAQNNCNKIARGSSKYLGVRYRASCKKYIATISYSGKGYWIGQFKVEEDAARAYDEAAKIHHGEFANLNFK